MRDSWIDKGELDDLLDGFSSPLGARKKKTEKSSNRRPRQQTSSEVAEKEAAAITEEDATETAAPGFAISSIDEIEDYLKSESAPNEGDQQPDQAADFDLEEEWNRSIDWVDEENANTHNDTGESHKDEPSPQDEDFEESAPSAIEDARNLAFFTGSDSAAGDDEEEDDEEIDDTDRLLAADWEESDAERAVRALAEAKAKAERASLLREELSPPKEEAVPTAEEEEDDEVITIHVPEKKLESETEESGTERESGFVDRPSVALSSEDFEEKTESSPEVAEPALKSVRTPAPLRREYETLLSEFSEASGAESACLADDEGMLLWSSDETSTPLSLIRKLRETALACDLGEDMSSLAALGQGKWLFLLYSARESRKPVLTAVLPKPLGNRQIERWRRKINAAV